MVSRFPISEPWTSAGLARAPPMPLPPHAERTTTYLKLRDMFVAMSGETVITS